MCNYIYYKYVYYTNILIFITQKDYKLFKILTNHVEILRKLIFQFKKIDVIVMIYDMNFHCILKKINCILIQLSQN